MPRPMLPEPPHGTTRRYRLRRDPCRCRACRRAWALYLASYRMKRRRPEQMTLPPELRIHVAASEAIGTPSAP